MTEADTSCGQTRVVVDEAAAKTVLRILHPATEGEGLRERT